MNQDSEKIREQINSSESNTRRKAGRAFMIWVVLLLLLLVAVSLRVGIFRFTYGQYVESHAMLMSESVHGWHFPLGSEIMYITPERSLGMVVFHLSTLIERLLGMEGSYMGMVLLQILLVMLICLGAGMLTRSIGGSMPVAVLAAGLVIAHASDSYTNWIGVPNLPFYIAACVFAVSFYIRGIQADRWRKRWVYFAASATLQAVSLFTCEGGILVIASLPLLILVFPRFRSLGEICFSIAAAWVVPFVYSAIYIYRMIFSGGAVYQRSLLSGEEASPLGIFLALMRQVVREFNFIQWHNWSGAPQQLIYALAGTVAVLIGVGISWKFFDQKKREQQHPGRVLGYLFLVVLLGLAPFAFIFGSADYMRTQMLAAPFVCVLLAMGAMFLFEKREFFSRIWLFGIAAIYLLALVFYGFLSAQALGSGHSVGWLQQRKVLAQILEKVPDMSDNTVLLVIPSNEQAKAIWSHRFFDDMWFDFDVRRIYLSRKVDGIMYNFWRYKRWHVEGDKLAFSGYGLAPGISEIPLNRLVVLQLDETGKVDFPTNASLVAGQLGVKQFIQNPSLILFRTPDPRQRRMLHLDP